MTPEERDVFEQIILDHNRHPKHYGPLADATHDAEGYNPVCGDRYHIYLRLDGDVIAEARFEGHGCAISKASASMMTDLLSGKTRAEAEHLFAAFHGLLTTTREAAVASMPGDLMALMGVRQYPRRVKCATLAWHAMRGALDHEAEVSTE